MQRGRCAYYNGHMNECCTAGINYFDLAGFKKLQSEKDRQAASARMIHGVLPCFSPMFAKPHPTLTIYQPCKLYREPTQDEIQDAATQAAADAQALADKLAIILPLLADWRSKPGEPLGKTGEIDCPLCKRGNMIVLEGKHNGGKLLFRCSTEGCFSHKEK